MINLKQALAAQPLNEADIPPDGRDSASLRPIGTSDAQKSFCRAQGVQLISQHVGHLKMKYHFELDSFVKSNYNVIT